MSAVTENDIVLRVSGLHKTFHIGFLRKRVEAVRGCSFEVRQGEIFGLLGPNGAGKTTTIKMILRLIFPTEGEIQLFGRTPGDPKAMRRIGYMPENPYVYQYLTPLEFLDLCGRLMGMAPSERRRRAEEMVELVGLSEARNRSIGKFSKGMTQRIGLAQALMHDPELLVLDEPMSGLDPLGRKEVRDVLLEQKRRGKTLLFTSHILSDVEQLCDRVVIMKSGKIASAGRVEELIASAEHRVDITLSRTPASLREALQTHGRILNEADGLLTIRVEGDAQVDALLELARGAGARLDSVVPERHSLETLFVADQAPPG